MHWTRLALISVTVVAVALGIIGSQVVNAQDLRGSTYPGPYYLGSTDSPVVLEEYADFQ